VTWLFLPRKLSVATWPGQEARLASGMDDAAQAPVRGSLAS
jgi:hypothetical protein